MNNPTYKTEFPKFELGITIPNGFVDHSWHNDAMPIFINNDKKLVLFVDYIDQRLSDYSDVVEYNRFLLFTLSNDEEAMADKHLISSNNFKAIIKVIDRD